MEIVKQLPSGEDYGTNIGWLGITSSQHYKEMLPIIRLCQDKGIMSEYDKRNFRYCITNMVLYREITSEHFYGMRKSYAVGLGICVKCRLKTPKRMEKEERAEYIKISGLCPACQKEDLPQ
jgi:hypothetical protein